ncbi:retropepsin-like aspartic protease family protein [Methylomicrobium sp. RS1]|uniref:retropepsin-like aspartic protease family protein n=1 Tax=Candidatus Methylomicrobium oryzae TaxID=2802053 RepID=UPI0019211A69|nr:retropepsin-like aspartic protease [Methylomicrobium sp. RS1]MBL1265810.1 retroviral-like aspartic protease family protein [Methylomicrobium sp. RS1]
MGIQDRDYYRGRYRNSSLSDIHGRSSGLNYLWLPALTLAVLWYGSDAILERIKTGKPINPLEIISARKPADSRPGSIVLKTDRQGHFRGTVLVNNMPMPFLIDTGATKTVIPVKMAIAAGLPFGRAVQSSTAGGKVVDRITRINTLKIGNAEIRNLDANINEHLDEVLIGMNTLRYFHMTQNGDTLTLVANDPQVHRVADAQAATFDSFPMRQPIKKPTVVKKNIICDEHQVCKTTYSDH